MYGYYYLHSIKAWPKWIPSTLVTGVQVGNLSLFPRTLGVRVGARVEASRRGDLMGTLQSMIHFSQSLHYRSVSVTDLPPSSLYRKGG